MKHSRKGFTIIEVLIAIIILSVGVLALSSGAGSVTRMMSSGQAKTRAYAQATSYLEKLRSQAKALNCGISSSGSWSEDAGVWGAWTVQTGATNERHVRMIASYRTGRAVRSDTLYAAIYCP